MSTWYSIQLDDERRERTIRALDLAQSTLEEMMTRQAVAASVELDALRQMLRGAWPQTGHGPAEAEPPEQSQTVCPRCRREAPAAAIRAWGLCKDCLDSIPF